MDSLLKKYTLWWCMAFSTPIAILEGTKHWSPWLKLADKPMEGYLLSNHVYKIIGNIFFPTSLVLYDFTKYMVMSHLTMVPAMISWYQSRIFSEELSDQYTSIGACMVARLAIDVVHCELVAPERDYLNNHIHHFCIICVALLTRHPDLYSLGLPLLLSGCVFEVGSTILDLKIIISGWYNPEQWSLFCFVHDYGFRLIDLLGLIIFALSVCIDFRSNGVPSSPLVWLVVVLFMILVIIREWLFTPISNINRGKKATQFSTSGGPSLDRATTTKQK